MNGIEDLSVRFNRDESSNNDYEQEGSDSDSTSLSFTTVTGGPDDASTTTFTPMYAVRKDNRMVTLVRGAVMGVLMAAAVLTSYYSFKVTRDAQIRLFDEVFDSVASKLAPGLVNELSLRLWQASTIASTIQNKIKDKQVEPHLLDFEPEAFADLSGEARLFAGVYLTAWSPLLKTEQERLEFEAMAASGTVDATATLAGNEICYVCGSPDRTIANTGFYVDIPGVGPATCGDVESAGLDGAITPDSCRLTPTLLVLGCICKDVVLDNQMDEEALDGIIPRATQVSMIDEKSGDLIPRQNGTTPYMPLWTMSGAHINNLPTMLDQMSLVPTRLAVNQMMETNVPMFTEAIVREGPFYDKYTTFEGEASTTLFYPVNIDNEIIGSVSLDLRWKTMITSVIPRMSEFVHVVVENSLGQNFTLGVDVIKNRLDFIGVGDLHEPAFDSKVVSSTYDDFDIVSYLAAKDYEIGAPLHCRYRFHVFAKQEFQDLYVDKDPIVFSIVTAAIFVFTSFMFILFDWLTRRVQRKVVASAKHTTALVTSLFPKNVRDRLLQQAADLSKKGGKGSDARMRMSKMRMQSFLDGGSDDNNTIFNTEPIADLFASATVMFLDIASFTAWSSEREPSQVFILLETIYQAFDQIAGKLSVFKVETIGDSYVAVCGLPTRREGHAPVMAKFAQKCLAVMKVVTKNLEVRLGPSTGDLQARVGLHSGPVTAGVLRGEKARFQLFGDTVNTAARLESTGQPGRIHMSQNCVDLLEEAGKGHWALKREKLASIKGKGELQTYFFKNEDREMAAQSTHMSPTARMNPKTVYGSRLIEWNTEVLWDFLKRIVVHRQKRGFPKHVDNLQFASTEDGNLVIDELTETLCLPSAPRNTTGSTDNVKMPPDAKKQLHEFVKRISATYRKVPFHNFEHCSHVLMSTSKLMKRIVNPDDIDYKQRDDLISKDIHRTTYGISSDPILQFASLFAALIHDVDHTGLTNAELIDEKAPLAAIYRNQSVAEQNSVDLAWGMLMEPKFEELRSCIYGTEEDLVHFRQLVVNAVMATDIADKQLKQAREKRWDETFSANPVRPECAHSEVRECQRDRDRKATVVFEYIIQASDVCHTMQHWHTYQKFNKRLFEERYVAWLNGSLKKEPSLGWYGGELWFYDNYIIPLANKLDKCGVFGVSYHEYLTYAKENRREWELKGKAIVDEMKSHCDEKYASQVNIMGVMMSPTSKGNA